MSNLDFHTQNYIPNGIAVNESLVERERSKQKDNLFFLIISFIALSLMLVIIILNTYVFFIADVSGSSMTPTLSHNDKLFTNRYKDPTVDSIVTIKHKENGNYELWIKRVIAVGGDTVEIKDGFVYVNGELKIEPYITQEIRTQSIKDGKDYGFEPVSWTLKEDEIFFLGDNRHPNGSRDSRYVGPYKTSEVVGVVEEWSLWLNARKK